MIAVCQPSVPVIAAIARMEAENDPLTPRSMTLMGGPIDTRRSPTAVNQLAEERGIDWFKRNCIVKVPPAYPGFWRDVYPGFLQLSGFMAMNIDRHVTAHWDMFKHLVEGDGDSAEKHRDFYDEYLAVMDLTAEFYLQTVEKVFVTPRAAQGRDDAPRRAGRPHVDPALRHHGGRGRERRHLGRRPDPRGPGPDAEPARRTRRSTTSRRVSAITGSSTARASGRDRAADRRVHPEQQMEAAARRERSSARRRRPGLGSRQRQTAALTGRRSAAADCGHANSPCSAASPADPPPQRLATAGRSSEIALRRRPTARRITLRVSNATGEVVLTHPGADRLGRSPSVSPTAHGAWIATRLAKVPARVRFAPRRLVPLRGVPHQDRALVEHPGHHPGRRRHRRRADPRRLRATAPRARRVREFLEAEARRDLAAAVKRHTGRARRPGQAHHRARHQEPLGLLLGQGRAELLLAADHGAALRARLPCRARGRAPARAQPFAPLLARRARALPAHRGGRDVAEAPRQRPAPLRLSRLPQGPRARSARGLGWPSTRIWNRK